MKLELLKSIINDLHMAGIYDIPSDNAMDIEQINKQALIKSIFASCDGSNAKITESENFDEDSINAEINNLFANFGSGNSVSSTLELIKPKEKTITKSVVKNKNILDPRLSKKSHNEESQQSSAVIKFNPDDYLSLENNNSADFAIVLNYNNLDTFKKSDEFKLFNNILKAMDLKITDVSLVFIDDSHKKITLEDKNHFQELVKQMQKHIKCLKQDKIICFGQDCLNLTLTTKTTIRQAQGQVFDLIENKKLLANYSLSAIVNSAKYKALTWHNLLTIKKI